MNLERAVAPPLRASFFSHRNGRSGAFRGGPTINRKTRHGMGNRFWHLIQSYLLVELWQRLAVTGRHLFRRKITVQHPEDRTPKSPRFKGFHALSR